MGSGSGVKKRRNNVLISPSNELLLASAKGIADAKGNVDSTYMEKLLKTTNGVQAWNLWRAENNNELLYIKDFNLDGLSLDQINFSRCIIKNGSAQKTYLYEANFAGSHILASTFKDATMMNVNLQRAKLDAVIFAGASLDKANFFRAKIMRGLEYTSTPRSLFYKATLREVNMGLSSISNVDFDNCKAEDIILDGTQFWNTKFNSCDLDRASLVDVRVRGKDSLDIISSRLVDVNCRGLEGAIRIEKSNLHKTCLDKTKLFSAKNNMGMTPILNGTILFEASCKGADWRDAPISHSKIEDTDFSDAHLENLDFSANIYILKTDFLGARIKKCRFEGMEESDLGPEFIRRAATAEGIRVVTAETRQQQNSVIDAEDIQF